MAAIWDFLREPIFWVEVMDPLTMWVLFLVSIALFGIAVLALRKKPSVKLKWVTIAFGLFFVKSALMMVDMYFSPGNFLNNSIQGFFDLLIMLSFFVALFRK